MSWLYDGQLIEDISQLENSPFGFVYIITQKSTGKKYIGRKLLTKSSRKTIKGKKKKIRVESDWKTYWGSSPALLKAIEKHGLKDFEREIVKLCYTKSECSYWETKLIFETDAIISEDYFNDWVSCKISGKHLKNIPR